MIVEPEMGSVFKHKISSALEHISHISWQPQRKLFYAVKEQ